MISICIPTYNRLYHLKRCISSIFNGFKNVNYPYEVIIADGGSTDGTLEYLRGLDEIKLIEQRELTGAVKACNLCFKAAKGDYIFLLNDDVVIFPEIIVKICRLMEDEKQIGLVGPKLSELNRKGFDRLHRIRTEVFRHGALTPKFLIFRHSILKKVGYFDESYRTYFIDVDFPLTILTLGYTIIFTRETGLIHYHIKDENINAARAANLNKITIEKDGKYYQKKWGYLPKKLEEYLSNSFYKKYKSKFFTCLRSKIYDTKQLNYLVDGIIDGDEKLTNNFNGWAIDNKFAMNVYDWLLEQMVIFKDYKYDNLKDFYLAQKYPDDLIK